MNDTIRPTILSCDRIALFRALGGLGDFLCVVPALRAVRSQSPQAEIQLIGLASTRELASRFGHYIDQFVEFPGYPGLPEQVAQVQQLPTFWAEMQARQFDLAIQLHGSGLLTNPLTVLFGARHNAGFFLPGQYCPNPDTFLPYREDESEIRRYLRLLDHLGVASTDEALEFPLWEQDWHELSQIPGARSLRSQEYVCIHPGASVESRRWSVRGFAIAADRLARAGFRVVLTGSASERGLAQAVANTMQAASLNLAGHTCLGSLAALLTQARLLVCNDTGVSHLAAALHVPSVVIFTGSDPGRWAPLDRNRHRAISHPAGVTVEAVITQIQAILKQESAYVA